MKFQVGGSQFGTRRCSVAAMAALSVSLLWLAAPAFADFVQQGQPLVARDGLGPAPPAEATSVALSADGNTAILGGPVDNNSVGAAYVFTRQRGGPFGVVWTEQAKLVGAGLIGTVAQQGWSVALSADGNTAIVGGPADNNNVGGVGLGAAWVFIRSGTVWTQQAKLVGTGAIGMTAQQGFSVALSADGNTAIVGGPCDNPGSALCGGYGGGVSAGAAWIFTRSGDVWTQQAKLVGTGSVGAAQQGSSVALSSDGNTAIVGGPCDNPGCPGRDTVGAAWVFTRSGGVWTQQGNKLVGTGAVGNAAQGWSAALSGDGDTAIVGGPFDNSGAGATWVFTRNSLGVWSQQGSKLVGVGASGSAQQGWSVALAPSGNSALVGGPRDDRGFVGAAWMFIRSSGGWTQLGNKLVGNDTYSSGGIYYKGTSVALSCNTALVGGPNGIGAAWVFVARGPTTFTHDFNADCLSDILWRHTSGAVAMWLMSAATVPSALGVGPVPNNLTIVGQRDFNGDGFSDILWRNTNGGVAVWLMNGATITSAIGVGSLPVADWSIVGTGDFNGDGVSDVLWRNSAGGVGVWLMGTNGFVISTSALGSLPGDWTIAGTGDFNGDGFTDILWRNSAGGVGVWLISGNAFTTLVMSAVAVGSLPIADWTIAGTGDFDGNGVSDILWRNSSGGVALWLMNNNGTVLSAVGVGSLPIADWTIAGTGDFNGDGRSDILWRNSGGGVGLWLMDGATVVSAPALGSWPNDWQIQSANAD